MSCPALPLAELSAAFRQRGELVARFTPAAAEAFACCAEWLEVSLAANLEEPLTLAEAARESDWSYEGLRRRLKEEPSLNAGTSGAPLIRRADLPRLGSPRGPRGPYGPRKPRGADVGAPSASEPSSREPQLADSEVSVPDCDVPGAAATDYADEVASSALSAAPDASGTDAITLLEESGDDETSPAVRVPSSRSPSGRHTRPTPQRTRRHSSKERFNELLTRAALG